MLTDKETIKQLGAKNQMNKEIKEKILKEVCKKYGYDSLDNATMMGAELIQETSKHYEDKLTQTNLRNHSREQNIKKAIEELKQKVKDEAKKTNPNVFDTKRQVFDYDTECFINYLDELLNKINQKHFNIQDNLRGTITNDICMNEGVPEPSSHELGKTASQTNCSPVKSVSSASGDSNSKKYTEEECDCKMFVGGSGKLCPDCEEETNGN